MQTELLMIGTELLLGQVEDTNAGYLARSLATAGVDLYWKTTVGDNASRINDALQLGLSRSDTILCSGGLGPTADDITRDCVAQVLDMPLEYHADLFDVIEKRFRRFKRPLSENNRRQAFLPKGAVPIVNLEGTAPGLIAERGSKTIICMPGVPRELRRMCEGVVIPYLKWKYEIASTIHYRVLLVEDVGESRVDALIADLIQSQHNPTIGLLASAGLVRVRIAAKASSQDDALALIEPVEREIRERLAPLAPAIRVES
ncbi:MAG: hypothetical protein GX117_08095 [Candidatus Hydrogenedentes bacterium]|jgi:nicotinamide-nucleotide amidase|nr:hypothetical protein [Candidatus Hydrogenedentota bacterium]